MNDLLIGSYCDGCSRTCELVAPRCATGHRQARRWAEERKRQLAEARRNEEPRVYDGVPPEGESEREKQEHYWDQFDL